MKYAARLLAGILAAPFVAAALILIGALFLVIAVAVVACGILAGTVACLLGPVLVPNGKRKTSN